jgi:hypothetical protein
MNNSILGGILTAVILALPGLPARAQETLPAPSPPPAESQNKPAASDEDVLLRIDVVRLARGYRVSEIVGRSVHNDAGEKIGVLDDLIVRPDDRVVFGVVSVGGFLGIGDRLVAIPYRAFIADTDGKLVLAGVTKEDLKNAPAFNYADKKD